MHTLISEHTSLLPTILQIGKTKNITRKGQVYCTYSKGPLDSYEVNEVDMWDGDSFYVHADWFT